MPAQDDSPMEQTHTPDNNLNTPSVTTIALGQDTVSALEVSVDFHNSEISLTIVHRPPLEQPIMTTRTRAASFSESEYESEFHTLEEDVSSRGDPEYEAGTAPVAAVVSESGAAHEEEGIGNQNEEIENAFIPEYEGTSSESSEDYGEDHTTESLAITLVRRALGNAPEVGNNEQNILSTPPSRPPVAGVRPMELRANYVQLCFFNPPEPSYVLHETEDGVTVDLTNETKLKFFSVESEEIEDALDGLPTIAPKIRSLIEKAKEQLSEAIDCVLWDLSGKKPDILPEQQESESRIKQRGIVSGLDVQVKFTVTATCFGEKMAEMTI